MTDVSRFAASLVTRDKRGWKIKTRFLTFHPISYGTATLARLSVGLRPDGHRLMLHYFPKQDYAATYHDHPWSFWTLVLWGAYIDRSIDAAGRIHYDVLRLGSFRHRAAQHRHKTRVPCRAVTLVLTRPASRAWCEGDVGDWKCDDVGEHFNETLGHIPAYESPIVTEEAA